MKSLLTQPNVNAAVLAPSLMREIDIPQYFPRLQQRNGRTAARRDERYSDGCLLFGEDSRARALLCGVRRLYQQRLPIPAGLPPILCGDVYGFPRHCDWRMELDSHP